MTIIFIICLLQVGQIFTSIPHTNKAVLTDGSWRHDPYTADHILGYQGDCVSGNPEKQQDLINGSFESYPTIRSQSTRNPDKLGVHDVSKKNQNKYGLIIPLSSTIKDGRRMIVRLPEESLPEQQQGTGIKNGRRMVVGQSASLPSKEQPNQGDLRGSSLYPAAFSSYSPSRMMQSVVTYPFARQEFENLCEQIPARCRNGLSVDSARKIIVAGFYKIPKDQLNIYNSQGQTIAHVLTPVHWLIFSEIDPQEQGVNLLAKTNERDKHPGSTLAHNLAGFAWHQNSKDIQRSIVRTLCRLYGIDEGAHFDQRAGESRCTVWDLMDQAGILNRFYDLQRQIR